MKRLLVVCIAAVVCMWIGCGGGSSNGGGGNNTPTLQSISITPSSPSVGAGLTIQLTATGNYSDGSTKNLTSSVTWSSSNTSIATVTPGGLARGITQGTATIQAVSGTLTGNTTLTVTAPNLVSIAVAPANPSVAAGLTLQLTATGNYSDGSTKNLTRSVTWTSSNISIATVTTGGLASGVSQGTATILAVSGTVTGNTTLTVTAPNLVSILVAPPNPSVFAGLTQQFTATGTYTDNSAQNITSSVTWTSGTTSVATITSSGLATGVAQGTSSITATSGSISGSTTLNVKPAAVVSIAVTPVTAKLPVTFSLQFIATATLTDGTTANITGASSTTWHSDNTSVATISNSLGTQGLATGVSAGTAHITAVSTNAINGSIVSNAATLTVTNATLQSITLDPSTPQTISLVSFELFTATGHFSDGTTLDLTQTATWNSSNPAVARVAAGEANAVGLGTTNITASQSGVTSSPVQLTVNLSGLVSIAVQPSSALIAQGTSQLFRAIATFENGATLNVSSLPQLVWSSDNQAVATIRQSGVATGQSAGTAQINATLGSFAATPATLTVTAATIQSITVTPNGKTIPVGATQVFTATGTFSDSTTQVLVNGIDVGWTSSDPSKVNISLTGIATALAPTINPVTITATFQAYTAPPGTATLNVTDATLQSIAITPVSYILAPASTVIYNATGTYSDGTTQSVTSQVTWNSSDTSVATFTGNTATGIHQGNSTITATLGGVTSNSGTLIVEGAPLVSISITPLSATSPQQIKTAFTANGTFADGNGQNLTNFVVWTSDPTTIATISNTPGSQGQATSNSTGQTGPATITAAYGGLSSTATLVVTSATLTSITIIPPNPTILVGQTQFFKATGTFSDQSTVDLTAQVNWGSSNGAVAVINSGGAATGIAPGAANITATLNGVSSSTVLTVQ